MASSCSARQRVTDYRLPTLGADVLAPLEVFCGRGFPARLYPQWNEAHREQSPYYKERGLLARVVQRRGHNAPPTTSCGQIPRHPTRTLTPGHADARSKGKRVCRRYKIMIFIWQWEAWEMWDLNLDFPSVPRCSSDM